VSDIAYLDSSAIVKTIVEEPESRALDRFLIGFETHVSSELARAEVVRAVRRAQPQVSLQRTYAVLERLVLVEVSDTTLDGAGLLEPATLRTLDAIHLTTAQALLQQLGSFVSYDERMAAAAAALGLPVEAPR